MKMRSFLSAVCAVTLTGQSVFAAPPTNITEAIDQINADATLLSGWLSDQFRNAVPYNSNAGNVVPSQLKVMGISVGASAVVSGTEMDNDALRNMPTNIVNTAAIDTFDRLPMPLILGHAKIGLPWGMDAGIRIGGIPKTDVDEGDTRGEIVNNVVGLDVRKALIQEGMSRPFGLTLGLTFTRAKGHIEATTPYEAEAGVGVTLNNAVSTARTDWDTKSLGLQAVLNKKIAFVNPYLGVGVYKNFGDVDSSIRNTGTITHTGTSTTASLDGTGGTGHSDVDEVDLRGMLGVELSMLPFLRLHLGGEVATNNSLAGQLGLRVQFR